MTVVAFSVAEFFTPVFLADLVVLGTALVSLANVPAKGRKLAAKLAFGLVSVPLIIIGIWFTAFAALALNHARDDALIYGIVFLTLVVNTWMILTLLGWFVNDRRLPASTIKGLSLGLTALNLAALLPMIFVLG